MSNAQTELRRLIAEGDHQGARELMSIEGERLLREGDQQGIQDLIVTEVQRMLAAGDHQGIWDLTQHVAGSGIILTPLSQRHNEQASQLDGGLPRSTPNLGMLRSIMLGPNPSGAVRHGTLRDDAYDLLTQNDPPRIRPTNTGANVPFLERGINHAMGVSHRLPRSHFAPRYGPAREAPLSSADGCRCQHFRYEHAIHLMHEQEDFQMLNLYDREHRLWVRSCVLGGSNFGTTSNRQLVELRQARALVDLDVSEYDIEIARRVLANPGRWGSLGWAMRHMGWVEEVIEDGEDYTLY